MATKSEKGLGKNIRKFRKAAKLTQEQLADKASVTPKYIQYIEAAKRTPSLKLLSRIARVVGVEIKELFG